MNRAVQWEGGLYYQVFCGGPGVHDGGLEDITVPYSLSHCEKFPEKRQDGFFWLSAEDAVKNGRSTESTESTPKYGLSNSGSVT